MSLYSLEIDSVERALRDCSFRLYGKRGDIALNYDLCCNGERVGKSQTKMVLSGLREYQQSKIDEFIERYNHHKNRYTNSD